MWKELIGLFKKEGLSEEAYQEAIEMLEASRGMFADAVASIWRQGPMDVNIYARDKQINKYERSVRRKIFTHLAVSSSPDTNMALVLTSIVIDIERIGDFTKNIVELATEIEDAFHPGELETDIRTIEETVTEMYKDISPALHDSDMTVARKIIADHEQLRDLVEARLHDLIAGGLLAGDSESAVIAALYLRYLKRISAHLKNVATSVVNPYYRIGFREKSGQADVTKADGDHAPEI